jgi:hypothetical protein
MARRTGPAEETGPIRSFELLFPADLSAKQVLPWVHALGGLLVSGPRRLFGVRSCVLELLADDHGLHYTLTAAATHADYLANLLRTHLPGVRVEPTSAETKQTWTIAVELGMRRHRQTLHVPDPASVSTSLLASLREIRRGECAVLQWVVTPALHERPPAQSRSSQMRLFGGRSIALPQPPSDRILDQRDKLDGPNLLGVLRVGIRASSEARAGHLLGSVRGALGSLRTVENSLQRRVVPQRVVRRRITDRRVPLLYPAQLTSVELVALLGWPIGNPQIAGLPQARTRHLPATESIARRGRELAISNFPGAERPLAIAPGNATHIHAVGPTNSGKTVLLANLAAADIARGAGVIVMESKGDLFRLVVDAIPDERLDDVIVLDMADQTRPVGYNLLAEGNPRIAIEEIGQLFEYLYPDMHRGIWARAALHRGLSTLITRPGTTFIDLVPLLSPHTHSAEKRWRDELVAGVGDQELARFWKRFDALSAHQQEAYVAPILDRVWQLNERPAIRNVIGQSHSSFTMGQVLRERKILLINLAGLGAETASLTGTLLMNALWTAVRGGAADPQHPSYLFLDEFQTFLNLPIDPEELLVQARSFHDARPSAP